MVMKLLTKIFAFLPSQNVYAHCDIPCGIYDPTPVQIAAHTVLRMTNLLMEAGQEKDGVVREHQVSRLTRVKEKHGQLVEEELGTLENDYFKEEHHKKYPQLGKLILEAVKLSVKTRQTIDEPSSKEMLEKVLQISEIFYKSKDVTPVRVKSLYPTGGEMVVYK